MDGEITVVVANTLIERSGVRKYVLLRIESACNRSVCLVLS